MKEVEAAEQPVAEAPSAFSLSPFESMANQEAGCWFTPRHPETGRPVSWRLLIAGIDSTHYAAAMNALTALRQERTRGGAIGDVLGGFDYREVKDGEVVISRYICLDWEPLVEPDGTPIPCNDRTKDRLFKEHRWLADQIILFCRNRANFLSGADGGIV